ncbi:transcriptional regulator swi6 [Chytriomyces hyalinus]|nr:transcriptional regulator swi6 [Chytriomyces hyalinus]
MDQNIKGKPGSPRPSSHVYSAIYNGVPVNEMMHKNIQIMRRIHDDWLNATHILKAAGLSKPKRTKILEMEVLQGLHEKVQGGYGKYQGTWIPQEEGIKLAKRHRVEGALRPILEFAKDNGDIALSKISFNAGASSSLHPNPGGIGKTASSSMASSVTSSPALSTISKLPNPSPRTGSPLLTSNSYLSASNAATGGSFRPSRANSEPPSSPFMPGPVTSLRPGDTPTTSIPTSPLHSPLPSRAQRSVQPPSSHTYTASPLIREQVSSPPQNEVPFVPQKRPVGRPPRYPRQTPAASSPLLSNKASALASQAAKRRRISHDYHSSEAPASPPSVDTRMAMDVGHAVFLSSEPHIMGSKSVQLLAEPEGDDVYVNPKSQRNRVEFISNAPSQEKSPLPEYDPFSLSNDDLQRALLLALHLNTSIPELVQLLRAPGVRSGDSAPLLNPDRIIDSRQHTALHYAATYARTDLVNILLSYGANPCAVSLRLETPLMRAVSSSHAFNAQNFNALLTDLGTSSARCLDERGQSILHRIASITTLGSRLAAESNYYMRCVVEWIDDGAFTEWLDHTGALPANAASDAAYRAKAKTVVGAFVNQKDSVRRDTALHLAVRARDFQVVAGLMRLGANVDVLNDEGERVADLYKSADGDLADEKMLDALRINLSGPRGGGGANGVFVATLLGGTAESANRPSVFQQQILACESEIAEVRRAQARMEQLHRTAAAIKKKQQQQPKYVLPKTHMSESDQHNRLSSASPPTSVTLSAYDSTSPKRFPESVVPTITLAQASSKCSSPSTTFTHSDPENGEISDSSQQQPSHLQLQQSTGHLSKLQEVSPPQISRALGNDSMSASPALAPLDAMGHATWLSSSGPSIQPAAAPFLTPPSTVKASLNSALNTKRLQGRYEATERSTKRLWNEIEQIVQVREDKTKRYRSLFGEACGVSVETLEDVLNF